MGVHGLWDLLAPVGRRVSVETLAGKRLAIDASIWMIQFMKAMRDEKGEMVRNAHLLGFFRRICKLLYLRTKPIFVFDGGTPVLKRRTVIARRRQRENAQAKIRKTAEKLLLNQLKQIRLKELAEELKKQGISIDAKSERVIRDEELEKPRRNDDPKGKSVITDDMAQNTSEGNSMLADGQNQECLDEMLAASLLAEEDENFIAGESSSGPPIQAEEEDAEADDDEELILPTMHGQVDPAILAALPPSMQLDLLVQMRERLMAENRQKYQKVKKVPARFSELQIQAYLKTVAFRREIDEVQKSAAGRGIGGVQTSRIASEANREFIFSSSFSGDKQVITSAGEGRRDSNPSPTLPAKISLNAINDVASKKCGAASGSDEDEPQKDLDNDVETYVDESGRLRVSRVRAMGIRMTRDIQRNLDLMKEIEEESIPTTKIATNESTINRSEVDALGKTPNTRLVENFDQDTDGMECVNDRSGKSVLTAGTSIEISFENKGEPESGADADDELFASLVAGDPVMDFLVDNPLSNKEHFDSASEYEWEEGVTLSNDMKVDRKPLVVDGGMIDENDLDWEEGSLDIAEEASSTPIEFRKFTSKGAIEEEADFQEAIRRSLQDLGDQRSLDAPSKLVQCRGAPETVTESTDSEFLHEDVAKPEVPLEFHVQECKSPCQVVECVERTDSMGERNMWETNYPSEVQLPPSAGVNCGEIEVVTEKAQQNYPSELLIHDASKMESAHVGFVTSAREKDDCETKKQQIYAVSDNDVIARSQNYFGNSSVTDLLSERSSGTCSTGGLVSNFDAGLDSHLAETTVGVNASMKDSIKDVEIAQRLTSESINDHNSMEREEPLDNFAFFNHKKEKNEVKEASLEEEMLILGEEQRELGDKQRKLERNAESVTSEMFTECQELLQIFGLPFIIAPMEAEAQCAYMELADLVDGVVTDDSDAFLFGARSVYKNIFDDRKYVETYFMKDIENELGLNREKLIHTALLLGSDYTEGVSGIGIVNAIEVLHAFPEEDGLCKFREWIESPDPSIFGNLGAQTGGKSRKRESKVGDADVSCSDSMLGGVSSCDTNVPQSVDETQKMKQIFMDKHRNVSKNWHLPSSFPSDAVISAYASPQVDKSTEPFSWGKPDLFVLRKLCWEKFGWSIQKADELLLPVLKEYNKRETQLRLEAFYTFNERFAKIRSKRIKKAVKGITGNISLDSMDHSLQDGPRNKKKRRVGQADTDGEKSEEASKGQGFADAGNMVASTEKANVKNLRKRRAQEKLLLDGETNDRSLRTGSCQNQIKGLSVIGRGRGRGRNQSVAKRSKKANSSIEYAESSSDDTSNSDRIQESGVRSEKQCLRRSGRHRKEVKYGMTDSENDEADQDNGKPTDETVRKDLFSNFPVLGDSAAFVSKINDESGSIEQELVGEYLEKGERLCVDKSEPERRAFEVTANQSDDFLMDKPVSKDYLTVGGGFCLDENEDDEHADCGGVASGAGGILFDSSLPDCSASTEGEYYATNPAQSIMKSTATVDKVPIGESTERVDASDINQSMIDTTSNDNSPVQPTLSKNNSGKYSARSLRALPSLRRKRRKS